MSEPVTLRRMLRAGVRGVSEYTGMVLALFVVQILVSWGAGLIMALILMRSFGDKPLFDDAVDGDLAALLEILRGGGQVFGAIAFVGVGAVLTWVVLRWFLAGGVLAVFTEQPRGRRETARCFGAGAVSYFLVFARLGLISFALNVPALMALSAGLEWATGRFEHALTMTEVIVPLVLGLLPAALLHVVASTIIDYARAELVLRRPDHESLGAVRTTMRAAGFVVRRPLALGHVLVYWAIFIAVSLGFAWLSHGHAMLGTSGALSLLAIREGLSLLRSALAIGVTAGQVELTATRPPPPREIVPVVETR